MYVYVCMCVYVYTFEMSSAMSRRDVLFLRSHSIPTGKGALSQFESDSQLRSTIAKQRVHWHSSLVDHEKETALQFDFTEDRVPSGLSSRRRPPAPSPREFVLQRVLYAIYIFVTYVTLTHNTIARTYTMKFVLFFSIHSFFLSTEAKEICISMIA